MAAQLKHLGVEVIFGLPGDQLMGLLDGLWHEPDIRFVTTRHEQGTTYLADGYARATGKPGVALVVPGVGVYNAAAGLATAYATSSPVLFLAGQVNRAGIGAGLGLLHDVHDQLEVVRPITKWAARVTEAADLNGVLADAWRELGTGRGRPVHVEAPPEAFLDEIDRLVLVDAAVPEPEGADPDAVAAAAALLAGASEPLVIVGGGVSLADASAELTAVAEHLQAAVLTTREGKGGIDDRHPMSVGTMWVNRRLRPTLDAADVVLAVGTRLQGFGFAEHQRIIHLDVDPTEIGKQVPNTTALVGHARPTLGALLDELRRISDPAASRAAERQEARRRCEEELDAVGPQFQWVQWLREGIPEDAITVVGTTTMGYACHMRFPVYQPRSYLGSSYMGTLGFAFPCALGAKVGCPDRPVVSIIGDGGFLFAATELATAVQHDIGVVTLVFDDGAYGNSNRDQHEKFGGHELGTVLRNPDFVAFAQSFGADGVRVDDPSALPTVIPEAIASGRPTVIHVPMERLPNPF
ncbi:MAG: hypothetical protein KDB21_03600 [Acidimicrobiales bacterium]|nr:hypothetical protein [Acidimicrobiales bacterium]